MSDPGPATFDDIRWDYDEPSVSYDGTEDINPNLIAIATYAVPGVIWSHSR